MEDVVFYPTPLRMTWNDFCAAVCQDEEPDLEPAENVLDDLILYEVGFERSE